MLPRNQNLREHEREGSGSLPLPLLDSDPLEGEMRNIRSIPGIFNGHGADISILVGIKLSVLIQISGFCHFCRSEFYVDVLVS